MTKNKLRETAFKMYDNQMENAAVLLRATTCGAREKEDYDIAIENFFEIRRYQQKILRERLKEIENE